MPRFVVKDLAWPHEMTWSSACCSRRLELVCILAGAPRLLALGKDDLVPILRHFAPKRRPRGAHTVLCLFIDVSGDGQDLNAVALFITLGSDARIINIACAYLGYEKHPSFRPTPLLKWQVSWSGAACVSSSCFIRSLSQHWAR